MVVCTCVNGMDTCVRALHDASDASALPLQVVAMHNSWDDRCGQRHGVDWASMQAFMDACRHLW